MRLFVIIRLWPEPWKSFMFLKKSTAFFTVDIHLYRYKTIFFSKLYLFKYKKQQLFCLVRFGGGIGSVANRQDGNKSDD